MTMTNTACETAVRVLTAAFADDPVTRWLLPDPAVDPADVVFRPLAQRSAAHGELALSADGTAAAVWLPRAAEPPVLDDEALPDHLSRLRTFITLTEQRHPNGRAHLHLVFPGVAPEARGRGLGGALLRERLAAADAEGVPAYLEASSPHSRPLYERHGFRVTGDPITLPDGPPMWPMWRDPRP
ncbi:GNAT family N-acetyltransferase [Streptosporangium sp. NBC_01495]|uniref:GNAT family N-acetyltransferase n=1 Tax=Streptosporangium sp. NBC_01495 TaxID=2903899 RepID=UPI002E33DE5F|nr:GNAT family N-acetyltransferase [Streptosporangium sp. NBC_01495]